MHQSFGEIARRLALPYRASHVRVLAIGGVAMALQSHRDCKRVGFANIVERGQYEQYYRKRA